MPRQRSSSFPRASSVAGPLSRPRYLSGLDYRQLMYSELRAPVSEIVHSNVQRSLRNSLSLLEEARDGKRFEASRHSSERRTVMPPPTPKAGKSESGYSCGPGWSVPFMADFSNSELDPQDSISNRGPSPLDNGRNWFFQPPPGWCNVHGCYMSGEFFDPKYRAWMQVIQPRRFETCRCHTLDPSALLALYSEKRNTRQGFGDRGRSSHHNVYDDDFEEPFAPRRNSHDDSRRSSLDVDWDHRPDPRHDIEQDWEPFEDWLD